MMDGAHGIALWMLVAGWVDDLPIVQFVPGGLRESHDVGESASRQEGQSLRTTLGSAAVGQRGNER